MADPISITGLLITVGQVISSVYKYSQTTKEAAQDIRDLVAELYALRAILEDVSKRMEPNNSTSAGSALSMPPHMHDMSSILASANACLEPMLHKLESPKSLLEKSLQVAKWHFSKDDIRKNIDRLERIKSALILVLMRRTSDSSRELQQAVRELTIDLGAGMRARQDIRMQQQNEQLLHWLAPVDPADENRRVCKVRQAGTGEWFIGGPFTVWDHEKDQRMLCLRGKSGCGKTTLFSLAVQTIEERSKKESSVGFGYFYCSFKDSLTQQLENILGSIAAQFARQKPHLLDAFHTIFKETKHLHNACVDTREVENILAQHFDSLERAYILVDAINESQQAEEILESLMRLTNQCKNLRILFSTTVTLGGKYDCSATRTVHLRSRDNEDDIHALIKHSLANDTHDCKLSGVGNGLKAEIERRLMRGANGSFRWVYLSIRHLGKQMTDKAVRRALEDLPETLDATYAAILARIPRAHQAVARKALFWLSFSARPLEIVELNEAVVLDSNESSIDPESRFRESNKSAVLNICSGLIEHHSGYITLAHSSVKTFLTSEAPSSFNLGQFSFNNENGDRVLMHRCLHYLSLDDFKGGFCRQKNDLHARFGSFPLLLYAAKYWTVHAKHIEMQDGDKKTVMRFLDTYKQPNGGSFRSWVQALSPETILHVLGVVQPLYYAASAGLASIINAIIEADSGIDVNAPGGRFGSFPLFVACYRGHYEAARLLLYAGASVDLVDVTGYTVPSYLYYEGHRLLPGALEFLQELRSARPQLSDSSLTYYPTGNEAVRILWVEEWSELSVNK